MRAMSDHSAQAVADFRKVTTLPVAEQEAFVRDLVFKWFCKLYEEGRACRYDLLSSISVLQEHVRLLQEENARLREALKEE